MSLSEWILKQQATFNAVEIHCIILCIALREFNLYSLNFIYYFLNKSRV